MTKGLFITFEGGEGAGKSTQIRMLADTLHGSGRKIVVTREPGGSPGAEAVRHVLLSGAAEALGPSMEAILFAAARHDHIEQLIRPALAEGAIVLCDRFVDSSRVYQGMTGELDADFMAALEALTVRDMTPDLTLLLDIEPKEGMRRASARRGAGEADRFEKDALDVQRRRRAAYLDIASREPRRVLVLDASPPSDELADQIAAIVRRFLDESGAELPKELAG